MWLFKSPSIVWSPYSQHNFFFKFYFSRLTPLFKLELLPIETLFNSLPKINDPHSPKPLFPGKQTNKHIQKRTLICLTSEYCYLTRAVSLACHCILAPSSSANIWGDPTVSLESICPAVICYDLEFCLF